MTARPVVREAVTLMNNGQKFFGVLHLPQNEHNERVPCVLICHGFGSSKVGRFRRYVVIAERLAQAGIATFRFDFRGAGDSEGTMSTVTMHSLLDDAIASAKYVANHAHINPSKIGFLGSSLGGAVSVLAAAELQLPVSLALFAPVFSGKPWFQMPSSPQSLVSDTISEGLTVDSKTQSAYFQNEKLHNDCVQQFYTLDVEAALKKLESVPLLHIQGGRDTAISDWHQKRYLDVRSQASGETQSLFLPNSGHDFSHAQEHEILLQKTTNWFIKYLF